MSYPFAAPRLAALGVLALLVMTPLTSGEAQFGKKLKDAIKQTAEDKAITNVTTEEGKAIDTLTERIKDSFTGDSAADTTAAPGDTIRAAGVQTTPGEGAAPAAPTGAADPTDTAAGAAPGPGGDTATAKPGEGVWANYDFKPGERVLFADDFTKDEVGDFPRRLELKEGNMEVVEWQGGRYLRATSYGSFAIPLSEPLPEQFTLEFDYVTTGSPVSVFFSPDREMTYLRIRGYDGGLIGGGIRSESQPSRDLRNEVFPVRLMVDGSYAKAYMGDKRVANAPNAKLGRSDKIVFEFNSSESDPVFFGNIRVAAGGKKLYDALADKGRVATQGIYFDTGSDRIRPESSGTLKEIGTMMKEHPELKLAIEGHTDNVGSDSTNQVLSEKRAAAVRQYLIDNYQVDGARLQAQGLGASKPATSNDTAEGRQQNRRVELVKL